MNNKKTLWVIAIVSVSGLFFIGLILVMMSFIKDLKKTEPSRPYPNGLPEEEIVFSPYDSVFSHGTTKETIGFVNSDGGSISVDFFYIAGGSAVSAPRSFSTYVVGPRWSLSGDELVFTIRDVRPNFRVIDSEGNITGNNCKNIDLAGYHLDFDNKGYIVAWVSSLNSGYDLIAGEIANDKRVIIRYDVATCQTVEKIIVPIDSEYWLKDVNMRDDVITAMIYDSTKTQYDLTQEPYNVLIFDTVSGDIQTFPGFHPSQSDDGSYLAYFTYGGNLHVKDFATGDVEDYGPVLTNRNGIEYVSRPGWSQDNKWLVYNTRDGEIYKINLETKNKLYVADGFSPDWR